ncbi:MAG: DUF3396 domain-containing protein [Pseudomonadota bacterium]|nr:DUF3396 domain-containing protein [Pseudomonadota bacterium]
MLNALRTLHAIAPATTDMAARLGFTVFVHGSLHDQMDALEDLWRRLSAGLCGGPPRFFRSRGSPAWVSLPQAGPGPGLADLAGSSSGGWLLELAEHREAESDASSTWWQFADLTPVRGIERASYVRVLLPSGTRPAALAALGEWSIDHLRLWWGAGGYVFHHTHGAPVFAATRMAALAKRHWAVQIQDVAALQWDALRGMPGVNWLTLVGDAFAQAHGMTAADIGSAAALSASRGVFHRRATHGIALAAGSGPSRGDINLADDLSSYISIARLVEPLLLTTHLPLSGPLSRPDVLSAWLKRYSEPKPWLECSIAAA